MRENRANKIGILSLGCPRNIVDSETVLSRLHLKGYDIADIDKADVAVVNTCAFIEDARVESIDAILDLIDLKRRGKLKKIIVLGCLVQRYKDKLRKELPEVDAFVGKISLNHDLRTFSLTPSHYAYFKICEGCVNNCSYCVIPRIKGKFNSLDMPSIIKKVERLDEEKISELNIVGQDITGYGIDLYGVQRLPQLLKGIVKKTKNIGWIRLLYLYPSRINDELIELIANEPKFCKYIDIPIQHINERILKLMNRHTSRNDILRLIGKMRKKIRDVALRTSLIVGFPSETDKEFKELLAFVEDIKFERLGVFTYSPEEGTEARDFKKQLPKETKLARLNAIMLRQQDISKEINKKFLGETLEVLIDEREEEHYLGRSQYDAPEVDGLVYIKSARPLKPGDFIRAKIIDTLEYDLVGETIDEHR